MGQETPTSFFEFGAICVFLLRSVENWGSEKKGLVDYGHVSVSGDFSFEEKNLFGCQGLGRPLWWPGPTQNKTNIFDVSHNMQKPFWP